MTQTLEPVSNEETWQDQLEFYDDETGDPWFTLADESTHPDEITMRLRDKPRGCYVKSWSLTGGDLVITGDGIVEFSLSLSGVCSGHYEIGILYTKDDVTKQVVLGYQPIEEGL